MRPPKRRNRSLPRALRRLGRKRRSRAAGERREAAQIVPERLCTFDLDVEEAVFRIRSASPTAGRKLLVDCGCNLCLVLEAFAKSLPDFEIFGFEPQRGERIEARMEEVRRAHPNVVALSHEAVHVRDGPVSFYASGKVKDSAHRSGSSLMSDKRTGGMQYESATETRAIDFARWLHDHARDAAFVAVKMDIEGAEYDVLEHLLETKAIDLVDMLFVEFHWDHFGDADGMKARHRDLARRLESARTRVFDWA